MKIRLTFSYTGEAGTATIQWYRDGILLTDGSYAGGVVVSGATTTTIEISDPTIDWEGNYYATVTDDADCTSTTDIFPVDLCTLEITVQPETQTIQRDETLTLSVTVIGNLGPLTYQWLFNGTPLVDGPSGDSTIVGSTTATLSIENIRNTFDGDFTVQVSDTAVTGCEITSDPATITVVYPLGPGDVPAWSSTSDIVLGNFAEYPALGTGPILTRRVPEQTALQTLNLDLAGGAAYYPPTNKFYHGSAQTGPTDGLVRIIDPVADTFTPIYIAGEDGNTGGRAYYFASINEIWVALSSGGNMFLRLQAFTGTFIGYIAGDTLYDFDYCASNDCLYGTSATALYKIDSTGTVTTILTAASIGVANASFGAIAYCNSLDRVIFLAYSTTAAYFFAWQLDPATDATSPYANGVGGSYLYYTSIFDRFILQSTTDGTPSGLPVTLGSYDTAFAFVKALHYSGGTSDSLTAPKGCFCTSVNKIALPVLQGLPGNRFYDLGFYGAADLT